MPNPAPPMIAQTLNDSCWAAVLESWSSSSRPAFVLQRQADLIRRWGEGRTGGITPAVKLPEISTAFGLGGGVIPNEFWLSLNLPGLLASGNVFLGYRVGRFCHAVLAYDLNDQGEVMVMNPNRGGRYEARTPASLIRNFGLIFMTKTRTPTGASRR